MDNIDHYLKSICSKLILNVDFQKKIDFECGFMDFFVNWCLISILILLLNVREKVIFLQIFFEKKKHLLFVGELENLGLCSRKFLSYDFLMMFAAKNQNSCTCRYVYKDIQR